ncbi:MAG: hypothetical protein AVDCRST_MAG68-3662 [uncultured Gemmatimonadetes bacterium]|uniref:Uncharacterized protein n=1 Tax=uncultured Gemmatimonadota bacterium TaxID=203437 RepID=A0A6J4M6K2_9BACT|nr:MAG: hypothetical protein AVDCRST_MAG68-3662 [uncultured Gemmatimonadota bacterium]
MCDPLGKRRAPDPSGAARLLVIRLCDGRLLRDPLHGTHGDAHLRCDVLRGEARLHQGLYGVSVDHSDHPPSPAGGGQQPCTERRQDGVSDPGPRQSLERIGDRVLGTHMDEGGGGASMKTGRR